MNETKDNYYLVYRYKNLLEINDFYDLSSAKAYIDFMEINDYIIIEGNVIEFKGEEACERWYEEHEKD